MHDGADLYDVCLSFAGEDRQYVERVAAALRALDIRVFYDAYEEAELWGKDLVQRLAAVFEAEGTYCVVFVSESYVRKLWTRHELQHALNRAFRENREYLLPARFDDTELPGTLSTIAHIDLRRKTPGEVAELIQQKLDSGTAPALDNDPVAAVPEPDRSTLRQQVFQPLLPAPIVLTILWMVTLFALGTMGLYPHVLYGLASPLWLGFMAFIVASFVTDDHRIACIIGGFTGAVMSAGIAYGVDDTFGRAGLTIGVVLGSAVTSYAVRPGSRWSIFAALLAAVVLLAGLGLFEQPWHLIGFPGKGFLAAALAAPIAALLAILVHARRLMRR